MKRLIISALALLMAAVGAVVIADTPFAQVNPVYSQDPVTGNATQQQQVTVPAGQTWTCLGACSGTGISVAIGAPLTGCGTAGGSLFNNASAVGCSVATLTAGGQGGFTGNNGAVPLNATMTTATGGLNAFFSAPNLTSGFNYISIGKDNTIAKNQVSLEFTWAGSGSSSNGFAIQFAQDAGKSFRIDSTGLVVFGEQAAAVTMDFGGTSASFPALIRSAATLKARLADNSADATMTAATQSAADNSTNVATTAFVKSVVPATATPLTSSLGSNVAMTNTATYFPGPAVAQGSTGTWYASGTVTFTATVNDLIVCKLWDGTTVAASAQAISAGTVSGAFIALSGMIAAPAGNLRIDCKDTTSTTLANMVFNVTGNSKDSTITATRVQ